MLSSIEVMLIELKNSRWSAVTVFPPTSTSPLKFDYAKDLLSFMWHGSTTLHLSIHPSSAAYPVSGRGGNEAQTTISLATLISSSWGTPRCSQARRDT